jgi:hypothetical protein
MRKITTALTAAALALGMLAQAIPAGAVTGFDSQFNSESAFVNINPGQTQNFQVFFINTGTTTWTRGTGTQVDLAACLEDKTTCNAQDASEAAWNTNWLSANRYATTVNTSTAPGAVGTFTYNVTAPVGAANGIYRFNGDLVLSTTGEKIHPEGYYQEANLGGAGTGGAAVLTSLTPTSGTTAGGTAVTINGTGIVCTPAFPSVSFGGTAAAVNSCGSTSVGVSSPAHASGAVTVTLTNSGAPASNGLTFTFVDTSRPTFTSLSVAGSIATVTFSEPVCRVLAHDATDPGGDWTINNISSGGASIRDASDSIPLCTAANDEFATTANIQMADTLGNPITVTPGALVEATLNARDGLDTDTVADGNESIRDAAGNFAVAPQARQATAGTPETTAPTLVSASGAVGSQTITLNFSEAVFCSGFSFSSEDITLDDQSGATDPTITGTGTNACGSSPTTADASFSFTVATPLPADRTFSVTLTPETNQLQDVFGNDFVSGGSVTFVTGAADLTFPTITDARIVAFGSGVGTSSNFADSGDAFSLTFSEEMNGATDGVINAQDEDGTEITINCGPTPPVAPVDATCTWNTAVTTVTVTLTATVSPNGSSPGATTGLAIPFNITSTSGILDTAGNPPNIQGSSDRFVNIE